MITRSKTTAQAFWEMIQSKSYEEVHHILQTLLVIFHFYREDHTIRDFLNHPKIRQERKQELFSAFLKGEKNGKETGALLFLLLKNKKFASLGQVVNILYRKMYEHFSVLPVQVLSAIPITTSQKKEIEKKILSSFRTSSIEWSETVNEDILGGFIVHVEDKLIDISLRKKLTTLASSL